MLKDGYYLKYNDGTEDGMEGFEYITIRNGKILPSLPTEIVVKAKAHASRDIIAEREAKAVQREREATYTLVRNAYNEGFTEGMKEHTKYNGGKPWEWSDAIKSVHARSALATYNDNRKG